MRTFLSTLTFLTLLSQILSAALSAASTVGLVGGENVTIDQYPYQISLYLDEDFNCGGAILNKFYILTSATCLLFPADAMTIRAGSSFLYQGGVVHNVVEKFVHPNFNENTFDNDIAILKLEKPLIFKENISAVKLPQQNTSTHSADGLIGEVTGWGSASTDGPLSNQLQVVKIPTVLQSICQADYKRFKITDRMLCAGVDEGGKGPCTGDGGGPLVANGTVIGIISWGVGCAKPHYPGVYTRVSSFVDYINSIISK